MSKSYYDWLVVYSDGETATHSAIEIMDVVFEIREPDNVIAIIKRELTGVRY